MVPPEKELRDLCISEFFLFVLRHLSPVDDVPAIDKDSCPKRSQKRSATYIQEEAAGFSVVSTETFSTSFGPAPVSSEAGFISVVF
jgi:hypothetical protein